MGLAARRSAFVAFTISSFVAWLGSGDKLLMTIAMNEVMTVRNRAIYTGSDIVDAEHEGTHKDKVIIHASLPSLDLLFRACE